MLNKLKELVFGLDEFEKTKIEVRYEFINTLIPTIRLTEINDFELLEDCISKIKDQLRVKSSNLNKVISDPSKKLLKRDVLATLEKLNKIKYDFLNQAFNLMETNQNSKLEKLKTDVKEIDSKIDEMEKKENISQKIKQETILEHDDNNEEGEADEESKKRNIEINNHHSTENNLYENDLFQVKLQNGKIPYIAINFKKHTDYALLKKVSTYLFEEYQAHGTNIIIDNDKALIIPRFEGDNLFEMPRIEANIENIFTKLQEKSKDFSTVKQNKNTVKTPQEEERKEEFREINKKAEPISEEPTIQDAEYIEFDEKPTEFKTKKHEEDSLDAILMGTEKKRFTPKPDPKQDKNTLHFQKEEPIIVEKKKPEKKPEIEIEKKDEEQIAKEKARKEKRQKKEEEEKKEANIDNLDIEKEEQQETSKQTQKPKEELKTTQPEIDFNSYKFIIYRDDKIFVYLKESSKAFGELIIQPLTGNIKDTDYSYMWIFSKIFSSVLFETLGSHGTNIIMNYSDNLIKIIPRNQDDNLNINWAPKEETEDFINQIQKRLLLDKMNEALGGGETNKDDKTSEEETKHIVAETEDTISNNSKQKASKQKKANHLLEYLRKIP